jgi:uncharacterized protein
MGMIVELEGLTNGRRDFSWSVSPEELDLCEDNVRLRAASASVKLTVGSKGLLVEGKICAEIELDCVRCLGLFTYKRSTDFMSTFVTEEDFPKEHDLELSLDELTVDIFNGVSIDLNSVIREHLLLELPAYPVCSAECRGICPTCGKDRNIDDCGCIDVTVDPRWEALKALSEEG